MSASGRPCSGLFLPAGASLAAFPIYLVAAARKRNDLINGLQRALHLPEVPFTRLEGLGGGFYLTIAGLVVLAIALILFRNGAIALPLRFRNNLRIGAAAVAQDPRVGRRLFTFLIASWLFGALASTVVVLAQTHWLGFLVAASLFPAFEWELALAAALAATLVALFCAGKARARLVREIIRAPVAGVGLALALPLALMLVPRFLFKFLEYFGVVTTPFSWSEMLLPKPLPSLLVVYAIALLQGIALWGYLLAALEPLLGIKRSIFVTAFAWSILPLGFGMVDWLLLPGFSRIPGAPLLAQAAILTVYSVALGWLYIQTRSVLAVALMHGTILLFHLGLGYQINLNHPILYWTELALWIFVGWYLFRKRPVAEAKSAVSSA